MLRTWPFASTLAEGVPSDDASPDTSTVKFERAPCCKRNVTRVVAP